MRTINKIKVAKILSFILVKILRLKSTRIVNRGNIKYKLDLKQGIDLSIFIFGSFQKKITDTLTKVISLDKGKENFSILDIGSNIGDKSLSLARNLLNKNITNFMIYSIEPTAFAINKQIENLNLNNKFKYKIKLFTLFFTNKKKKIKKTFSSWNLYSKNNIVHGGQNKSFHKETKCISLDKFIVQNKIYNTLAIKLDVDGNELDVLRSGKNFLLKNRPLILMEYSPSALKAKKVLMKDFFSFIESINYSIQDLNLKKIVNNINVQNNSSIDILLVSNKVE
jgi:FkbM family methyltransferase